MSDTFKCECGCWKFYKIGYAYHQCVMCGSRYTGGVAAWPKVYPVYNYSSWFSETSPKVDEVVSMSETD